MEGQCHFIGQFLTTSFSQTQEEVIALLGHKFYYAQNRGWQSFALGDKALHNLFYCVSFSTSYSTDVLSSVKTSKFWHNYAGGLTDCYLQICYEESHFFLQQEKRLIQRVYHLNYYALNFSESIVIPDFIEILCKQLVTLPRDYPSCISVCCK